MSYFGSSSTAGAPAPAGAIKVILMLTDGAVDVHRDTKQYGTDWKLGEQTAISQQLTAATQAGAQVWPLGFGNDAGTGLTVRKAITLAGGFKERANRSKINVIRDDDPKQVAKHVDAAVGLQQIDAAYIVDPYSTIALGKPGLQAIARPYTEVQPGVDIGQYLTTGKYLAARPGTIDKFAKGLRRGVEWYNANRRSPELLEIVAAYTKIDVALLKTLNLAPDPLHVDPPQMKKTMELMIENKLLRAPLDIAKIIAPVAL